MSQVDCNSIETLIFLYIISVNLTVAAFAIFTIPPSNPVGKFIRIVMGYPTHKNGTWKQQLYTNLVELLLFLTPGFNVCIVIFHGYCDYKAARASFARFRVQYEADRARQSQSF